LPPYLRIFRSLPCTTNLHAAPSKDLWHLNQWFNWVLGASLQHFAPDQETISQAKAKVVFLAPTSKSPPPITNHIVTTSKQFVYMTSCICATDVHLPRFTHPQFPVSAINHSLYTTTSGLHLRLSCVLAITIAPPSDRQCPASTASSLAK